jgi:hypothetical protein
MTYAPQHPYASPLFGNFKGLPPLLIQAGDAEVLRDEITLLAHKATLAGVRVQHELYQDAVHVFQALPFLDACAHAFSSVREFVRATFADAERASGKEKMARQQQQMPESAELAADADNERTRVVQGDGADAGRTKEQLAQSPSVDSSPERTDAEDEDEDDHASWCAGLQSGLPSPPASDDDDEEDKRRHHHHAPEKPPLTRAHTAVDVSLQTHSQPSAPRAQTWRGRPRTMTMSSADDAPAPRPGIRSSASHVDISALCLQWASEGPANATTTFTHDGLGHVSRARPKAKTVFLPP